jgi:hypothetical protein
MTDPQDRLFIAGHVTGDWYCDTSREEHGDYKVLAIYIHSTRELEIKPDCPADLRGRIEAHANQTRQQQLAQAAARRS